MHLVGYPEGEKKEDEKKKEKKKKKEKNTKNQHISQCLNSVDSAVSGKVVGVQLGLCTEME